MPTYLPITALNRSQRVRIGGQLIVPGKVNFVDVGLVDAPGTAAGSSVSLTAGAKKAGDELIEGKFYAYVVTAVAANGGETEASVVKSEKTKAEAETRITVSWTAIPRAKK